MIADKLQNATISKEEFEALTFLDRRLYEQTARDRFSSLDTHLEVDHPDFGLRLEINSHIRDAVDSYIHKNRDYLGRQDKIRVIELGSSLGSISSLYALDGLYKQGLADKIKLTLLDICREPLERTRRLDFDLGTLRGKAGFKIPSEILGNILQNARIREENFLEIQQPNNLYTISLAPFIHHHLNTYDKRIACEEQERITAEKGMVIVGDLTFSYDSFIKWLEKHRAEHNSQGIRVPYAVESFISLEEHIQLFKESSLFAKQQYPLHYVFAMQK